MTERNLAPVSLEELLTAPVPAPPYVIRGLIPRRVVTLLGGHGGAGKSILGLTLAAHVAGGAHSWANHTVELGSALYVSLEDPGDVVRYRLKHIIEEYGLDGAAIQRRLTVLDGTQGDASLAIESHRDGVRELAFTTTMAEVTEAAREKLLVLIDNASDAFSANENERRQVRAFIRQLGHIAADNDSAVVLLAHIDKQAARFGSSGGNSYSGSTAWHNSVRGRLALVPADGLVMLTPEKLQHGKLAEPIPLAWSDAGVLVPCDLNPVDRRQAEQQQAQEDAASILRVLQLAIAENLNVPTAATGPRTTWHALCELPEMPKALADKKDGKRRTQTVLTALERKGTIVREPYVTAQRKPSERWALAHLARADAA